MLMQIDAFLIIIHRWSTCCIGSSPIPEAGFLTIFYYHLNKAVLVSNLPAPSIDQSD
jgi:hypothetical protein